MYRLTFAPIGPGGVTDKPEPVATGDWPTITEAWSELARERRMYDLRTFDPGNYWTIPGASSANGRVAALHIISVGTMEVWETE